MSANDSRLTESVLISAARDADIIIKHYVEGVGELATVDDVYMCKGLPGSTEDSATFQICKIQHIVDEARNYEYWFRLYPFGNSAFTFSIRDILEYEFNLKK